MSGPVMVYGATGFSGRALAARLCEAGCDVVVAGRTPTGVQALAQALDAPFRVFHVDDPGATDLALHGVAVVLNAAGPFMNTASPMIDACIRAGAHYLDLSGEWPVFAMAQDRGADAMAAGIMLMPGVGFAVVVSDCLAAHAVRHAPETSLLRFAIGLPEVVSRGTLRSALRTFGRTVIVRKDGALRRVAVGAAERSFDFGAGERMSIAVSWPDVITAQTTTGARNTEAYLEAPLPLRVVHRAGAVAAEILGDVGLRGALAPLEALWPDHPSAAARSRASNAIVVEAVDPWRRTTRFGLKTLDGYSVTNATASGDRGARAGGRAPARFPDTRRRLRPRIDPGPGMRGAL